MILLLTTNSTKGTRERVVPSTLFKKALSLREVRSCAKTRFYRSMTLMKNLKMTVGKRCRE